MLEKVLKHLLQMQPLIVRSGAKPQKVTDLYELSKELDESELKLLERDLTKLREGPWKECNQIYTLPGLTPEVWKHYDAMGIEGLQEQKLIAPKLVILRKRFAEISRSWTKYQKRK